MSPGFCNIVSEIIIGVWYANTLLFLPTKNPSKPPLTPSSPFSHGFHPPTRCAEFDLMEVEEGNSHLQDADRWRQPALLLSVLCSLLHRWRHKCKGPCAPSCSQKNYKCNATSSPLLRSRLHISDSPRFLLRQKQKNEKYFLYCTTDAT